MEWFGPRMLPWLRGGQMNLVETYALVRGHRRDDRSCRCETIPAFQPVDARWNGDYLKRPSLVAANAGRHEEMILLRPSRSMRNSFVMSLSVRGSSLLSMHRCCTCFLVMQN